MFRKLWLDVIMGTLFVFGTMGFVGSISQLNIFDAFDPIGEALGEMTITDLVMSKFRSDPIPDENVVLVNISSLSRPEIGLMLNIINQYNPRVVGIDTFFDYPKEDTLGDMILAEAFWNTENLVLANKFVTNVETDVPDSVHTSWPMFSDGAELAMVNLITTAKEQGDLKMCRSFWPKMKVKDDTLIAFAVKLASYLDPGAAQRFLERNVEEELIDFKGNVLDYGLTEFGTKFYALDVPDVFGENFTPETIEGKIVMFCYLGEYLGDRSSIEDKFITPINASYVGRALPDMYGGVIHANAISMILNENYIDYMTAEMGIAAAIVLCFLNVLLFTIIYKRIPRWYDGLSKMIQLIEALSLYLLMIVVFDSYNYKMELTLAIVAILLAGDLLEIYHGIVKNTFTKEGRRALFKADKLR